jgi:hypothetical protein
MCNLVIEKFLFSQEAATFENLDHELLGYKFEIQTKEKPTPFGIKLSISIWLKLKWKRIDSEEEEETSYEVLI